MLWVSLDFYGVGGVGPSGASGGGVDAIDGGATSDDGAKAGCGGGGGDFMHTLKSNFFMGIFGFYILQILFKWIF